MFNKVIFEKGIPCDSVIYRYIHNTLTIDHSFQNTKRTIEITAQTLKEFLGDKRLVNVGYIGKGYTLTINKSDTSVNIKLPLYFRELTWGKLE